MNSRTVKIHKTSVKINGITVTVYSKEFLINSLGRRSYMANFIPLNSTKAISNNIDITKVLKVLGIYNVTDLSVPQAFFDSNSDEIITRGGVVWSYRNGSRFGEPIFLDELWSEFRSKVLSSI